MVWSSWEALFVFETYRDSLVQHSGVCVPQGEPCVELEAAGTSCWVVRGKGGELQLTSLALSWSWGHPRRAVTNRSASGQLRSEVPLFSALWGPGDLEDHRASFTQTHLADVVLLRLGSVWRGELRANTASLRLAFSLLFWGF